MKFTSSGGESNSLFRVVSMMSGRSRKSSEQSVGLSGQAGRSGLTDSDAITEQTGQSAFGDIERIAQLKREINIP